MGSAQPYACLAIEEFVKQHVVAEVRILHEPSMLAYVRTAT
jgi:hypothetical protein